MDLKKAITEIPELIKMLKEKFSEVKKENFKDAKLKDGTIIRYDGDMPAQGMPVMVISEQGEIPLADGEYVMEDGVKIVVSKGVIAEVESAEAAPVAEEQMEESAPVSAEPMNENAVKRIVESIVKETVFSKEEVEEKISAISTKEEIENLKAKNESLSIELEKQKQLLKETFALVEIIAGQPAAPTKIEKKDGFKKVAKSESILLQSAAELSKKVFK